MLLRVNLFLAEQLEHYKEMKELMYNFVKIKSKDSKTNKKHILTEDERNLLSVAYKNLVGEKRNAWRLLCALERTGSDNDRKQEIVRETREKTESDVHALCQEINDLLEKYLLPSETGDNQSPEETESTVFYHKMKADYFRLEKVFHRGLVYNDPYFHIFKCVIPGYFYLN